ncbi:hypothetical protein ACJ73_09245 [Blastomyces percursus]|uniref:Uncharacterized protein n=1 Tax=Blastomyces percursus TaxID=1658174 RepID=A0A1J9PAX0_9EURO|nr:hypothetical protein ACJ73_09245 [Blastomyces percursus]
MEIDNRDRKQNRRDGYGQYQNHQQLRTYLQEHVTLNDIVSLCASMYILEPQAGAAGFTSTSMSHASRNFNHGRPRNGLASA